MDRELDLEVVVCERCGGTGEEPADPSKPADAHVDAVPVKKPPLMELTTPSGRVWYIVNPN
jgi:hypothetical protein